MKAVFIVYGQALTEPIQSILDTEGVRGFTRWDETFGRGSNKGEPHYGTHAWPSKNTSILAVIDDDRVEQLLSRLRKLNAHSEQHGLNAYVWNVDDRM